MTTRDIPTVSLFAAISTILYWAIASVVVAAHLYLCHPAIVCRSLMAPNDIFALFIAPALVGLPAISGAVRQRRLGLLVMTLAISLIYALVQDNLGTARPHPGSYYRMFGLIYIDWRPILIHAVFTYPFLLVPMYFIERVGGDMCSSLVRMIIQIQTASTPDQTVST